VRTATRHRRARISRDHFHMVRTLRFAHPTASRMTNTTQNSRRHCCRRPFLQN
jgi:hypothetical protein